MSTGDVRSQNGSTFALLQDIRDLLKERLPPAPVPDRVAFHAQSIDLSTVVGNSLARDAARYGWLRAHGFSLTDPKTGEWTFGAHEGVHVDEAIDRWIKEDPKIMHVPV